MKARVAVLGVIALTAVACSSSSGGSSNAASTSPPAVPPSSASPTGSATPSPSATPTPSFSSTVQAAGTCTGKQLAVSVGQTQGSAGHFQQPIVFTNTGAHGCTLFGHPGASFVDSAGNEVGPEAKFNNGEQATVTLAARGTANAILSIPDPGVLSPSQCRQQAVSTLRVYPPGVRKAFFVADSQTICTSDNASAAMSVSPVTPGSGA